MITDEMDEQAKIIVDTALIYFTKKSGEETGKVIFDY